MREVPRDPRKQHTMITRSPHSQPFWGAVTVLTLVGVSLGFAQPAGAGSTIPKLRGILRGSFGSNTGGESGVMQVRFVQDKTRRGYRTVKAQVNFGSRVYPVSGVLIQRDAELNMSGVFGAGNYRTGVIMEGTVGEDGRSYAGEFAIIPSVGDENHGDFEATR